jgi:hypothetical protein
LPHFKVLYLDILHFAGNILNTSAMREMEEKEVQSQKFLPIVSSMDI